MNRRGVPGIVVMAALLAFLSWGGATVLASDSVPLLVTVTITEDGDVLEHGIRLVEYRSGPWVMATYEDVAAVYPTEREGSSSRYVHLAVDHEAAVPGVAFDAEITIKLLATASGNVRIEYDSLETGVRDEGTEYVRIEGNDVGNWVVVTFQLPNMQFGKRIAGGNGDVSIRARSTEVYIQWVEIKAVPR